MAPPVYTDMNIVRQSSNSMMGILELGIELGFEQFAINHFVPSLQGGKEKKHDKVVIPPPREILLNDKTVEEMQKKCQAFKQLSRLTAVLNDVSGSHRLGCSDIQSYDILAVQATDEKTFQQACSTLEVDIICLNFSENLGFSLKRSLVRMAAKRGIHFEIVYGPALRDNTVKRNIISNAMSLVSSGGGKNIILSSGSEQAMDLRSPYDVINLAKLFGLSTYQAKDAICRNCRAVLKHAELRKTCKSVVSVMKSSKLSLGEQWVVHQNTARPQKSAQTHTSVTGADSKDGSSDEEESNKEVTGEPKRKKIKL